MGSNHPSLIVTCLKKHISLPRSPGGISSISDTPAIPPKSVFSGNTFGQKFSFSESDKAMNNNDVSGSGGGTASGDQSLLAPPDAGAAELVRRLQILRCVNSA